MCSLGRIGGIDERRESGETWRIVVPTVWALLLFFAGLMGPSRTSLELKRGLGLSESVDSDASVRTKGEEQYSSSLSELRFFP